MSSMTQKMSEAGSGNAVRKADHEGMKTRHLVDDNDRGTMPAPIDGACPSPVVEFEARVVLECGRIVHRVPRHGLTHLNTAGVRLQKGCQM